MEGKAPRKMERGRVMDQRREGTQGTFDRKRNPAKSAIEEKLKATELNGPYLV